MKDSTWWMIWGKLKNGEENRLFSKLSLVKGARSVRWYFKNAGKYYDDLVAYRWSSDDHSLNFNPNKPEEKVSAEYMRPFGSVYDLS